MFTKAAQRPRRYAPAPHSGRSVPHLSWLLMDDDADEEELPDEELIEEISIDGMCGVY